MLVDFSVVVSFLGGTLSNSFNRLMHANLFCLLQIGFDMHNPPSTTFWQGTRWTSESVILMNEEPTKDTQLED